ncbi:MAG: hypothetical protein ACYTBP_01635 [Planctomycetota bacterium]|jgi:hypothetical protein
MKNVIFVLSFIVVFIAGCEQLRFAPNEAQKQNAWLHKRTTAMTAETAKAEHASDKLQNLAQLSDSQAKAVTSYFGIPKEFPDAGTANDILAESNVMLADQASSDAERRPDVWELADATLELGIGICALLGGVYGARAVGFLKDARDKSKALKEIVEGNELFKQLHSESINDFKAAQKKQSSQTRQIVAQLKS